MQKTKQIIRNELVVEEYSSSPRRDLFREYDTMQMIRLGRELIIIRKRIEKRLDLLIWIS